MNSRERVLRMFNHEPVDSIPVFSGYGNITLHGVEKFGWKFSEIHTDAEKMARVAASTYELFGFECAVAPFDMGVEAEVLGSKVNYYTHRTDVVYPTIEKPAAETVDDLRVEIPSDLANAGRIPLVREALSKLKERIGEEVVVGSWVLGPYTQLGQIVELSNLSRAAYKKQALVNEILDKVSSFLIEVIRLYREAGADYITVREMGAGPDILSPAIFRKLIKPHLDRIFSEIDSPNVLHMCGDTNMIIELLGECGADAVSVENKNDVVATREKLGADALILGDIDAYNVLVNGTPEQVEQAVKDAVDKGVNALWPGCDIWPTVPRENMQALMRAAREYGKREGVIP